MLGRKTGTTLAIAALISLAAVATVSAADWPQWRGPNADGISLETGLLQEWPDGGPPVVWEIDTLGEGMQTFFKFLGIPVIIRI